MSLRTQHFVDTSSLYPVTNNYRYDRMKRDLRECVSRLTLRSRDLAFASVTRSSTLLSNETDKVRHSVSLLDPIVCSLKSSNTDWKLLNEDLENDTKVLQLIPMFAETASLLCETCNYAKKMIGELQKTIEEEEKEIPLE
ncbi:hypothetical protein RCL1_007172 [Eukaryota sp. TZLM3-RCL]